MEPEKGTTVNNPFKREQTPSVLDSVIENLISEMAGYDPGDEVYTKAAANLKVLMEAKAAEPKQPAVSPDTLAVVAANIVGIVMILAFEKNGIITSRAFSLVTRTR